jgi:hypothetical protein
MTKKHTPNQDAPSLRHMLKCMRSLPLHKDADHILLIKKGSGLDDHIDEVGEALKRLEKTALILIVNDLADIDLLPPTRMAAHGWFKLSQLNMLRASKIEERKDSEPTAKRSPERVDDRAGLPDA